MKKICFVLMGLFLTTACNDNNSSNPVSEKTQVLAKEIPPEGALPLISRPVHYQLDMNIDPSQSSFTATAIIKIELIEAGTGLWLHGKDLTVNSLVLKKSDGDLSTINYQQKLDSGVAWVDFGEQLEAGPLTLVFDYTAQFDRNLSGLFKVEEQGDAYVLAKSESIQARKYMPGYDQPGFKSPYKISITIPKGMHAISNNAPISKTEVDQTKVKVQFGETRSMPTYLLSIAVGPFDIVEHGEIPANAYRDYPIPLRAVARRGRAKDMSFVMDITPRYVELFENALAQPYPFKKLDIVAAPQWPSGATELSAAITYREQRVLLGDSPAPGAKRSIMNTHAHEIAHMWFGNLVTPPWWDDLWLKEGFSTWATPMILSQFEPEGGHQLDAVMRNFRTMGTDSLASTRAIRQPILKNDNIRNAYDSITYSKSQAVINMIDSYFGSKMFREALGKYIAQYADGTADSPQFYQAIGEQTGEPLLTETFKHFVEQKGVPLMETALICEQAKTTRVKLTQSRYKPVGSAVGNSSQWNVPMCLKFSIGNQVQTHCELFTNANNEFSLNTQQCPDWIMPNANGSGYYRWQMDAQLNSKLVDLFDTLNDGEKVALLDNVFSSFEAGKIELDLLQKMVERSANSTVPQLVSWPLGKLSYYLKNILSAEDSEKTKQLITPWYLAKLTQLDSKKQQSSLSDNEQLLANRLTRFIAETLEYAPLRKQLSEQATIYMEVLGDKSLQSLSTDLYGSAFNVAVEDLGAPFFFVLLNNRAKIDDPLFDIASARAMGKISDPKLATMAQLYTISDNIGPRESFAMIAEMLSQQQLEAVHWKWFSESFEKVIDKIPAQWRRRSPRLAYGSCELEKISKLDSIFMAHAEKAPGHQLALAQTKEAISLCVALRETQAD
jgi:alanyl aminopeptidase